MENDQNSKLFVSWALIKKWVISCSGRLGRRKTKLPIPGVRRIFGYDPILTVTSNPKVTPGDVPASFVLAYVCAFISVACGIGLLWARKPGLLTIDVPNKTIARTFVARYMTQILLALPSRIAQLVL